MSAAILAFVGWDTDAAIPGRHPDRVADDALLHRVRAIIDRADATWQGGESLQEWGRTLGRRIAADEPDVSGEAIGAIVALLTYEWR